MKWPRGRYNGWRVVGFEVRFRFDLTSWRLYFSWEFTHALFIGPFHFWFEPAYHRRDW